ncbi:hypothetical protein KC717_03425 [Candidatus Dojkabacteria bacterium]|uniref:Uncharacterized protein n=1 Tax=Candidatus Dojkabacteria bacterium TaxID=2099670 RepID=A0A955RKA2_9BACT|nr:hypothetical protein [Candidatus Dojkabacteria bacterium]
MSLQENPESHKRLDFAQALLMLCSKFPSDETMLGLKFTGLSIPQIDGLDNGKVQSLTVELLHQPGNDQNSLNTDNVSIRWDVGSNGRHPEGLHVQNAILTGFSIGHKYSPGYDGALPKSELVIEQRLSQTAENTHLCKEGRNTSTEELFYRGQDGGPIENIENVDFDSTMIGLDILVRVMIQAIRKSGKIDAVLTDKLGEPSSIEQQLDVLGSHFGIDSGDDSLGKMYIELFAKRRE